MTFHGSLQAIFCEIRESKLSFFWKFCIYVQTLWNMFKINNKNARTSHMPVPFIMFLLLTLSNYLFNWHVCQRDLKSVLNIWHMYQGPKNLNSWKTFQATHVPLKLDSHLPKNFICLYKSPLKWWKMLFISP